MYFKNSVRTFLKLIFSIWVLAALSPTEGVSQIYVTQVWTPCVDQLSLKNKQFVLVTDTATGAPKWILTDTLFARRDTGFVRWQNYAKNRIGFDYSFLQKGDFEWSYTDTTGNFGGVRNTIDLGTGEILYKYINNVAPANNHDFSINSGGIAIDNPQIYYRSGNYFNDAKQLGMTSRNKADNKRYAFGIGLWETEAPQVAGVGSLVTSRVTGYPYARTPQGWINLAFRDSVYSKLNLDTSKYLGVNNYNKPNVAFFSDGGYTTISAKDNGLDNFGEIKATFSPEEESFYVSRMAGQYSPERNFNSGINSSGFDWLRNQSTYLAIYPPENIYRMNGRSFGMGNTLFSSGDKTGSLRTDTLGRVYSKTGENTEGDRLAFASEIPTITTQLGNWGQIKSHSAHNDMNDPTLGAGATFVQGVANSPSWWSGGISQTYQTTYLLGSEYGVNDYSMQTAIGRNTNTPYLGVRFTEGGVRGAWQKVWAGNSDKLGGVDASNYALKSDIDTSIATDTLGNLYAYRDTGWARLAFKSEIKSDTVGGDRIRFGTGGGMGNVAYNSPNINTFGGVFNGDGKQLFFGDNGMGQPDGGWNQFGSRNMSVGEWGNTDSDIAELHGKSGVKLTTTARATGDNTITGWEITPNGQLKNMNTVGAPLAILGLTEGNGTEMTLGINSSNEVVKKKEIKTIKLTTSGNTLVESGYADMCLIPSDLVGWNIKRIRVYYFCSTSTPTFNDKCTVTVETKNAVTNAIETLSARIYTGTDAYATANITHTLSANDVCFLKISNIEGNTAAKVSVTIEIEKN